MSTSGNMKMAKYLTRQDWGAAEARWTEDLQLPVDQVVTTWADVDPCVSESECTQRVRDLQKDHMEEGRLPDIQHNLMIGGDGNIYEGRGWNIQGPLYTPEDNLSRQLSGRSVEIAFLDKFYSKPSEVLMQAATDCVALGMIGHFLQQKVSFFLKSPGKLEYVSLYDAKCRTS